MDCVQSFAGVPLLAALVTSLLIWAEITVRVQPTVQPTAAKEPLRPRSLNLWEPSLICTDLLYGNGTSASACSCNPTSEVPTLSFIDTPPVLLGFQLPYVVNVTVLSLGSGCGDIVEAAFSGVDEKGQERTFGGHVEALGEDRYQILGTIDHYGMWELKARRIWRNFSPLSSCRCGRTCLQRDSWNARDGGVISRPVVVTFPPAGGHTIGADRPNTRGVRPSEGVTNSWAMSRKVEKPTSPPSRPPGPRYTCRTMEELMDGAWLWESPCPYQQCANLTDGLPPPRSYWQPSSCYLTVHHVSSLQDLFQGMHIHLVGDSTMHEVLRLLIVLFGFSPPVYPETPPCGHDNRVFDSGSAYPVRFSFAWAGGPDPCDNFRGITSITGGAGRDLFMSRYQPNADFVIVNAGLHDVSAGIPVESYVSALEAFFDMLLTGDRKDHRDRVIWLSTNPMTHGAGVCPGDGSHEGNGGIQWMNFMAGRLARSYAFTVMDSHRVLTAANLHSTIRGEGPCGDGHHCITCDACWAKVFILTHFMASVVALQRSQPPEQLLTHQARHPRAWK